MTSDFSFWVLDLAKDCMSTFTILIISLLTRTKCIAYKCRSIYSNYLASMGWLWSCNLPSKEYSGVTPGGNGSGNLPTTRASNPNDLVIASKIDLGLEETILSVADIASLRRYTEALSSALSHLIAQAERTVLEGCDKFWKSLKNR